MGWLTNEVCSSLAQPFLGDATRLNGICGRDESMARYRETNLFVADIVKIDCDRVDVCAERIHRDARKPPQRGKQSVVSRFIPPVDFAPLIFSKPSSQRDSRPGFSSLYSQVFC